MNKLVLFLSLGAAGFAEVRTVTLRQAIDLALKQSPDVVLANLDRQKIAEGVNIARDPFVPKVFAGSGLAYTNGYPSSIDGNAPSIVQVRADMAIYNRSQRYQVAVARENERGAAIDVHSRQDDVAYRTALLYLMAEQNARDVEAARRQQQVLERVQESVRLRVEDGRLLPIENKKAALDVLRARQRVAAFEQDQANAEANLALVLGLGPDDRVRPSLEERPVFPLPASEEASIQEALGSNNDVKKLESQMEAKGLEIKSYRASRLPQLDLVAQYALFAKYNYQNYFTRFQTNNGQLGVSIKIPLLVGKAAYAYAAQAEDDTAKLRTQIEIAHNRITVDTRRRYQELRKAEMSRDVAKADLDLAREQVSIDLAQMEEGRVPLAKVEASRFLEDEKWLAFYDAGHAVELARLELLKQTGTLLAALR